MKDAASDGFTNTINSRKRPHRFIFDIILPEQMVISQKKTEDGSSHSTFCSSQRCKIKLILKIYKLSKAVGRLWRKCWWRWTYFLHKKNVYHHYNHHCRHYHRAMAMNMGTRVEKLSVSMWIPILVSSNIMNNKFTCMFPSA